VSTASIPCPTCEGDGEIDVPCHGRHSGICGLGNPSCARPDAPCPDCGGEGVIVDDCECACHVDPLGRCDEPTCECEADMPDDYDAIGGGAPSFAARITRLTEEACRD
jgi:hypothetical protein